MVDRIDKIRKPELWEVAATKETKEEKKRDEQGQGGQEAKDTFGETSDFTHLLAKDPRKFSSEKIATTQITGFTFRAISTHREKALLEVDISMANGALIQGAQVAVSRQEGMKYISRRPGEQIVVDQIVKGTFLTVALPHKEKVRQISEVSQPGIVLNPEKTRGGWSWSYYLGIVVMVIAAVLLIYVVFRL